MRVFLLNTVESGQDLAFRLSNSITLSGIIGLSDRNQNDAISGFAYQRPFCETLKVPFVEVSSYSLKNETDRALLTRQNIDLLIVCGWQRLIPDWLISHCNVGVIGSHGSVYGITKGRGRSPQNWALLFGHKTFSISIFWIAPGVDSGDVIDSTSYTLSPYDDIRTSYYKCGICVARLIQENLANGRIPRHDGVSQDGAATYMPKRTPADGAIDWTRSSHEIYDFVRALTLPYPCAFSSVGDGVIKIKRCIPFDIGGYEKRPAGSVLVIFSSGDMLVKSGDGEVLVQDWSFAADGQTIAEGDVLRSVSYSSQLREIATRHQKAFPESPLAEDFDCFRE